ncbi:hypothetical protein INT47_011135 [Mucor saturninus]|uniref:F-box domain-containing protein n=1 Tax=Mucor saturninus TaxID=64648 RepID=A0A8H7REP0_9FUNG|nr:hypothetical protein INT47_011135 [Mucor saturninus]
MKSWSDLPVEILLLILAWLAHEPSGTLQYQLVCKNWQKPAQIVQFSTVYLEGPTQLNKMVNGANEHPHSPALITKVIECPQFEELFESQKFLLKRLASVFPFVDTLRFHCQTDEFYRLLLEIQKESKWVSLKHISPPLFSQFMNAYYKCIENCRDSIEKVVLWRASYSQGVVTRRSVQLRNFAEKLDEFSNLRELTYRTHISDNPLSFIDSVLSKCKVLKTLTIQSDANIDSVLFKYSQVEDDISSFEPKPDIQKLTWQLSIQTDLTLHYIMRKFPRLKSFYCTTDVKCYLPYAENYYYVAQETLVEFLVFCFKIEDCILYLAIGEAMLIETVMKCSKLMDANMLQNLTITFFNCFKYAYGCPQYLCRKGIEYIAPLTNKRLLRDVYHAPPEMRRLSEEHVHIGGFKVSCHNLSPRTYLLDLIKPFGSSLKKLLLVLDGGPCDNNLIGKRYSKEEFYLDLVLEYCPNLTQLFLITGGFIGINPLSPPNLTITDVDLSFLAMSNNDYVTLSLKFPSLKTLNVKRPTFCWLSEYHHISMPDSSLDSLTYTDHMYSTNRKPANDTYGQPYEIMTCLIKITTEKKGKFYYIINGVFEYSVTNVTKLTESGYKQSKRGVLNRFLFNCKSLRNLHLCFSNNSYNNLLQFHIDLENQQ